MSLTPHARTDFRAEEGDYEPRTTEPATSGDGQWAAAYANPQDYTGAGFGSGWEALPQRHHHPTRLSDVIEEEESRTSQVSRA